MDAPLGRLVGNSLEVIESIETLKGRGPEDLEQLSVRFAARMLIAAGMEHDDAAAEARVREALSSGAGVEKLRRIIEFQGGDPAVVDHYDRLPSSPDREPVPARRAGLCDVAPRRAHRPRRRVARRGTREARRRDRSRRGD